MGSQQDTIIYIEDKDRLDASVAANWYADKNVKNRAYVNTLGAGLALKYLASENIDIENVYNIHSIKKILEELDISDIMLPNIHIDVRVVFDENIIFIPKSHFKYNLVPDIYFVFNLSKDLSNAKFMGFFEPKLINKNNQNDEYYFIEKEKLTPVTNLKEYIENFKGNKNETLSEEEMIDSERIIMAMCDNDISEDEKTLLIKQLTKSVELRDKFIEYENFETLSYKAMTDENIIKPEWDNKETFANEEFDNLENLLSVDNLKDSSEDIMNAESNAPAEEINILEPISDGLETASGLISDGIEITENLSELGTEIAKDKASASAEILSDAVTAGINIVDDLIDIPKELTDNNIETKEPESIDFDLVDTSSIDNIDNTSEEIEDLSPETISFDEIDTVATDNNTDFINEIENKISFDDIDLDENKPESQENNTDLEQDDVLSFENLEEQTQTETEDNDDVEVDSLSFENIDTSIISEPEDVENINNEPVSLDDLLPTNISEEEIIKNQDIEKLASDDISIAPEDIIAENIDTEDLPSINMDESNLNIDTNEETENISLDENLIENSISENIDLSDISEDIDNINGDNIAVEDDSEENINLFGEDNDEQISLDNIDTNISEIEPEIIETDFAEDETNIEENINQEETNISENESQNDTTEIVDNDTDSVNGSELLATDNIDVDNNDIDNIELPENAGEISSSDLLSQIDDVLGANNISDSSEEQISEENTPEHQSLDNIPEIDDILSIAEEVTSSANEEAPQPQQENLDGNNENKENDSIESEQEIQDLLDIVENNTENENDENKLDILFDNQDAEPNITENIQEENEEQAVPGAAFLNSKQTDSSNKKTLILTAAIVTALTAAVAFIFLKPKADNLSEIEPITSSSSGNELVANQPTDIQGDTSGNILEDNAPSINKKVEKKVKANKEQIKELKNTTIKNKPISTGAYPEVKKLIWNVPDVLSYSPKMQNYLRSAGKSIKLTLSADLLLATEYAYSNQVKVDIKLNKNGNIQETKIITSSGSKQIDDIVLQSVKDTLNILKPPSSEINTPDLNLNLIIYL